MSDTSRRAVHAVRDRTDRLHRWTAALLTALFHALLVLLVTQDISMTMTMTAPPGGAGGGSMDVTLYDETFSPPPPAPEPVRAVRKPKPRHTPKAPPAIARIPSPLSQATAPMPRDEADTSETPTAPPAAEPAPPDSGQRTAHVWGRPPGMRPDNDAGANAALASKLGSGRSRNDNVVPVGPSMETDGFHVYYGEVDETRLRAWRAHGMTELFLPLPGTLRLMVCPLEVALRHGSGACHMVDMDSPELKSIGDAREVISVQRVYQLGDVVWSGPGPYR